MMAKNLVIILIISLVACLTVGFLAYHQGLAASVVVSDRYDEGFNAGVSEGDTQGYSRGLADGVNQGYSQGYQAGYGNGTANAPKPTQTPDRYSEGYEAGIASGKSIGYNDGYSKGTSDGFNTGYNQGYVNGTKDGAGTGYNIRDPTYIEMQSFISADQTDKNTYDENTYYCFHFCRDVLDNAFNQGFKAGFVYMELGGGAHGVVCFDTVDEGLVFVEPQSDELVTVAVGLDYDYVAEPNTITSYTIIW